MDKIITIYRKKKIAFQVFDAIEPQRCKIYLLKRKISENLTNYIITNVRAWLTPDVEILKFKKL